MESLSKHDREKALAATIFLCMRQRQGIEPEEQAAQELGFGSVEAIRVQLRNLSVPDWIMYSNKAAEKPKPPASAPDHKPKRSGGQAEQLPPLADALELFRAALDVLRGDLEYVANHDEVLQDGRFVAHGVYPEENVVSDRGASPFPHPSVVRLITAYVMIARDFSMVEQLVEKLHPEPSRLNRGKLYQYISGWDGSKFDNDGLRVRAKHIATEIRGKEVKRGRKDGRVSLLEQSLARGIQELIEQGTPEEEIREELELDKEEFERLKDLRLHQPSG